MPLLLLKSAAARERARNNSGVIVINVLNRLTLWWRKATVVALIFNFNPEERIRRELAVRGNFLLTVGNSCAAKFFEQQSAVKF